MSYYLTEKTKNDKGSIHAISEIKKYSCLSMNSRLGATRRQGIIFIKEGLPAAARIGVTLGRSNLLGLAVHS